MSAFTLGSINPLPVRDYSGLDYPDFVKSLHVIGDGTGADRNEVLQSSALAGRRATLAGILIDPATVEALRDYKEAVTEIAFTDPYGESTNVVVMALTSKMDKDTLRGDYTLTIVEV